MAFYILNFFHYLTSTYQPQEETVANKTEAPPLTMTLDKEVSDWVNLPVEEKCTHWKWMARLSGYDAAAALFRTLDKTSPKWNKFSGMIKDFVIDSNAPAQEKGLEAVLVFVDRYSKAGKHVNEICSGIVQKGFTSPKSKTRDLATELCLKLIEIGKQEQVIDELLTGTESKNPKVSRPCISVLTASLKEFGPRVINVKKISERIPTLLQDRDLGVRMETKELVKEIYRWLRESYRPVLKSLRLGQTLQKELEKIKLKEPAREMRFVRHIEKGSDMDIDEMKERKKGDGDFLCGRGKADCLMVDLSERIPSQFCQKLEEASNNWPEKKKLLESLESVLENDRTLQDGDYTEILRHLEKIVQKDSNIVAVLMAVRCIKHLAHRLGQRFTAYSKGSLAVILEKFKERKQTIIVELRQAADAIYEATSFEFVLKESLQSLKTNSNAIVNKEILTFLLRCAKKSQAKPNFILKKKARQNLVSTLVRLTSSEDEDIRETSYELLDFVRVQEELSVPASADMTRNLISSPADLGKSKSGTNIKIEKSKCKKTTKPKSCLKKIGNDKDYKRYLDMKAEEMMSKDLVMYLDHDDPQQRAHWLREFIRYVRSAPTGPWADVLLYVILSPKMEDDDPRCRYLRFRAIDKIVKKFGVANRRGEDYLLDVGMNCVSSDDTEIRDAGLAIIGSLYRRRKQERHQKEKKRGKTDSFCGDETGDDLEEE